jgi:hypothetical protein
LKYTRRADVTGKELLEQVSVSLTPLFNSINLPFKTSIDISIEMVLGDDDFGEEQYIGFRLFEGENDSSYPFYATTFETPLEVPIGGMLETKALQVEGNVSCDKKNLWAIQGQGESASTINNCIVCIESRKKYAENPPDFMSKRFPSNPHFQKKNPADTDAPL